MARLEARDPRVLRGSENSSDSGIGETDDLRAREPRESGAVRPAVRGRGFTGGTGGSGEGAGAMTGIEPVDEAVDCLKRSSVVIDIRGVKSTVLVGLTQESSFALGRGRGIGSDCGGLG